ncbi:hypothetical protein PInf_023132 [Phytophthora infestans]|nr:hypothetical protein PInf_023132 [Phytophthora infestans]
MKQAPRNLKRKKKMRSPTAKQLQARKKARAAARAAKAHVEVVASSTSVDEATGAEPAAVEAVSQASSTVSEARDTSDTEPGAEEAGPKQKKSRVSFQLATALHDALVEEQEDETRSNVASS